MEPFDAVVDASDDATVYVTSRSRDYAINAVVHAKSSDAINASVNVMFDALYKQRN